MSDAVAWAQLPDPVVLVTRQGSELDRNRAANELLADTGLAALLTEPSWRKLLAGLDEPRAGIEVVTEQGATWDVTVGDAGDGSSRLVVLRDVSRYTVAAARLTAVTHELAERQRDLQTLYDASVQLGSAVDAAGLGEATSRLLCTYLGATHVETRLGDAVFAWPGTRPSGPPTATWPLRSSGDEGEGELAWWRSAPLGEAETRLVGLVANRVAAGHDRARLLARTAYLARHDELTGLLNRSGGTRALETIAMPAALVMLDIDHFKHINDQHGHPRGDQVLQRFAEVLRRFRATDLVVRWGGEEFLLVLPATTAPEAVDPVDRLRRRVREAVHVGGEAITFSAGIADLEDVADFEHALRAADGALYEAKRAGRDRVLAAGQRVSGRP